MNKKSIVLLSGGMDSLLLLIKALKESSEVFTIFFDYGQKSNEAELRAFHQINKHFKIKNYKVWTLDFFSKNNSSALINPSIEIENIQNDEVPNTYVPFRNTIFLSYAVSLAESLFFDSIWIGAVQDDSLGYPDCREIYYEKFQEVIKTGSDNPGISVYTPIIKLTKNEIAQELTNLSAPVDLSWSCYKSSEKPCGVCDSCILRKKAFDSVTAQ